MDISDGLCVMELLFKGGGSNCLDSYPGGGEIPSCLEALDANNDGFVDCSDGIFILQYLFLGTQAPPPPVPFPSPCGLDIDPPGSPADLGCTLYPRC